MTFRISSISLLSSLVLLCSGAAQAENNKKLSVLMSASCGLDVSLSDCMNQAVGAIGETPASAVELIETECRAENYEACSFLGYLYEQGLLVPRDVEGSQPLFETACNNGIGSGCTRLGWLYYSGRVVPRDIVKAQALTEQGCSLGFSNGCNTLVVLFGLALDRQVELLAQGCDGGSSSACYNLAGRYERGEGVSVNTERAALFYQKSADLGGPSEAIYIPSATD